MMAKQTTSGVKYLTISTPIDTNIHRHMEAVTNTIVRLGDVEVCEIKTTKDIHGQYYTVLATNPKSVNGVTNKETT